MSRYIRSTWGCSGVKTCQKLLWVFLHKLCSVRPSWHWHCRQLNWGGYPSCCDTTGSDPGSYHVSTPRVTILCEEHPELLLALFTWPSDHVIFLGPLYYTWRDFTRLWNGVIVAGLTHAKWRYRYMNMPSYMATFLRDMKSDPLWGSLTLNHSVWVHIRGTVLRDFQIQLFNLVTHLGAAIGF